MCFLIEGKNGNIIEIGELRNTITFQSLITSVNENGFEIESWKNYKTVWAKVLNLSGKEYFEATIVNEEKIVKFIIRFISDIDEKMIINFKGVKYNIIDINNKKYENKYCEIKALEITSKSDNIIETQ